MRDQAGRDAAASLHAHPDTTRRCAAFRGDREAERVLALVSRQRAVPVYLLLHRSRCRAPVAEARQLAMYLVHTLLGRTMTAVGLYFGRDRSTVAHACGRIEDRRDEGRFDAEVTALEDAVLARAEARRRIGGATSHDRN